MDKYKTPESVEGISKKLGSSKAAMDLAEGEYDIPKELKKKALKAGMVKAKFQKKGKKKKSPEVMDMGEEEMKMISIPSSKKEHKLN